MTHHAIATSETDIEELRGMINRGETILVASFEDGSQWHAACLNGLRIKFEYLPKGQAIKDARPMNGPRGTEAGSGIEINTEGG